MLEKNQRIKSLLYLLLDAALLFISFLLANYIRFNFVRFFEPGGAGPALAVARDPRNILAGPRASTPTPACTVWQSAAPKLPPSTQQAS